MIYPTLYNVDSKDKVRTWCIEIDGGRYRTISGVQDGKQIESGWVVVKPKNVGKKNATTPEQQAILEVEAKYTKKKEVKYYTSIDEAKSSGKGTKFFSPMLAAKWKDVESKIDWSHPLWVQPKLDGYRATFSRDGSLSRGGKTFPVVRHIEAILAPVFARFPDLRLDGELYNHDLKQDFEKLGSAIKSTKPQAEDFEIAEKMVEYHVYDVPSHPGAFHDRHQFLMHEIFPLIADARVKLVQTHVISSIEAMNELYGRWLADGYEGQMVRTNDVYQSGPKRDARLIKRKEFLDEEYEVIRIDEGKGSWSGVAKSVVCTNGIREFEASIKGSMEAGKVLLAGPLPKYATIRFPNLTADGVPRFGIAVEFHQEKRNT